MNRSTGCMGWEKRHHGRPAALTLICLLFYEILCSLVTTYLANEIRIRRTVDDSLEQYGSATMSLEPRAVLTFMLATRP